MASWVKVGETSAIITAGAGNQSVTLPGSPIAGDLVLVAGAADVSLQNHIATGGYTVPENGTGANPGASFGYKVLTSTPDTVVDIVRHATILKAVVVQVWRGGNATTILDAAWATPLTGTSANPNADAVTVVNPQSLVVTVAFLDDDDTTTSVTPTGYTNKVEGNTGQASTTVGATVALASLVRDAGSENPSAWTFGSSDAWSASTISFRLGAPDDTLQSNNHPPDIAEEPASVARRTAAAAAVFAALSVAMATDDYVPPPPPPLDEDPIPEHVIIRAPIALPGYWYPVADTDELPGGSASALSEGVAPWIQFADLGPLVVYQFQGDDVPPQPAAPDDDQAPEPVVVLPRPVLDSITEADELTPTWIDEGEPTVDVVWIQRAAVLDVDPDEYAPPAASSPVDEDDGPPPFAIAVPPTIPDQGSSEELPGGSASALSEGAGVNIQFAGGEPDVVYRFGGSDEYVPEAPTSVVDDDSVADGLIVLPDWIVYVFGDGEQFSPAASLVVPPEDVPPPQVVASRRPVINEPALADELPGAVAPWTGEESLAPARARTQAPTIVEVVEDDYVPPATVVVDEDAAPAPVIVQARAWLEGIVDADELAPTGGSISIDDTPDWRPAVVVLRAPTVAAVLDTDSGFALRIDVFQTVRAQRNWYVKAERAWAVDAQRTWAVRSNPRP